MWPQCEKRLLKLGTLNSSYQRMSTFVRVCTHVHTHMCAFNACLKRKHMLGERAGIDELVG